MYCTFRPPERICDLLCQTASQASYLILTQYATGKGLECTTLPSGDTLWFLSFASPFLNCWAHPVSFATEGPCCGSNVMATRLHRFIFWFLHLALVNAVKWTGPSSTIRSKHSHVTWASLATASPSRATHATQIDTPSTYEPPHICGYVHFDKCKRTTLVSYVNHSTEQHLDNSYTCASHNTCLWNSHLKVIGCGNPTSINYITSCVPYQALDECDAKCLANPSVIRW